MLINTLVRRAAKGQQLREMKDPFDKGFEKFVRGIRRRGTLEQEEETSLTSSFYPQLPLLLTPHSPARMAFKVVILWAQFCHTQSYVKIAANGLITE